MIKKRLKSNASEEALKVHNERSHRFEFVRQRLQNVDIEDVWNHLEKNLLIDVGRNNIDKIATQLSEAENNLRRAGMIYQVTIEELEEFKVHYRAAYSEWSRKARMSLELDKKEKRASGMITTDMIENFVAENILAYGKWKAALRDLERNKTLAKQMYEAWESRIPTLRKLSDLVEKRKGISTDMLERRNKRAGIN